MFPVPVLRLGRCWLADLFHGVLVGAESDDRHDHRLRHVERPEADPDVDDVEDAGAHRIADRLRHGREVPEGQPRGEAVHDDRHDCQRGPDVPPLAVDARALTAVGHDGGALRAERVGPRGEELEDGGLLEPARRPGKQGQAGHEHHELHLEGSGPEARGARLVALLPEHGARRREGRLGESQQGSVQLGRAVRAELPSADVRPGDRGAGDGHQPEPVGLLLLREEHPGQERGQQQLALPNDDDHRRRRGVARDGLDEVAEAVDQAQGHEPQQLRNGDQAARRAGRGARADGAYAEADGHGHQLRGDGQRRRVERHNHPHAQAAIQALSGPGAAVDLAGRDGADRELGGLRGLRRDGVKHADGDADDRGQRSYPRRR
mmetsp:Transcript_68717/g.153943  ORF Transcript_68717/g.153943 Transcript_68717/m.153943 type:complete len:377 (-) Transcript_68717:98-1228(-)